eukprot:TRINITY_DN16754_c0_g1_i1.p1 TRINITY_DN16754_c0_g1~~TRINITY_DN16754_c0_g1_i1.p1  ORF type:complete len:595 (+),score=148.95 TRINITY_DN16754_c0_g1_i1:106-1785(+)
MADQVPVLVGAARRTWRPPRGGSGEPPLSPLDMTEQVTREAAADALGARAGELLAHLGAIAWVPTQIDTRLPRGAPVPYRNMPHSLAQRVGARKAQQNPAAQLTTDAGGHSPLLLLSEMAEQIGSGRVNSAIICGCEALASFQLALRAGYRLPGAKGLKVRDAQGKVVQGKEPAGELRWGRPAPNDPTVVKAPTPSVDITSRHEALHGLAAPATCYGLIEQAQRRRWYPAETVAESRLRCGKRFAGLSAAAARQPEHAWFPTSRTPSEIASPSAANREVALPYTKYMCAVMDVDQAAAVVLMSEREALRLGVPREKLVYVHGTADCMEPGLMGERNELHTAGALGVIRAALEEGVGVRLSDCRYKDIYPCFPCALEAAMRAFDVPLDTPGEQLTLTGGLPYHGGPGNNFALHSLAAAVPCLRGDPGEWGLVTANGGWLSKHSAAVLSCRRYPDRAYRRLGPSQRQLAELAARTRPCERTPSGRAVAEVFTIVHGRDGPERAVAIGRMLESGKGFVAKSQDAAVLRSLAQIGQGRAVDLPCTVVTKGEHCYFTPTGAPRL